MASVLVLVAGVLGIASATLGDWRQETPIPFDFDVFEQSEIGPVPTAEYVTATFPFSEFDTAKKAVEARIGRKLASRGEAHITIVTPPEFEILKRVLSASEIRQSVENALLASPLVVKPICIGSGSKAADQTWFVVVEADLIRMIRASLEQKFVGRGGSANTFAATFNAASFHPHVTLGFVNRDLHLQDGVVKDLSSCRFPIVPKP